MYTMDDHHSTFGAGMTYLPPPIPDSAWPHQSSRTLPMIRRSCVEPHQYDPEQDELLNLWLEAYDFVASQLRMSDGSELEPESGVFGTVGMFNARSARLLWPSRDELLLYEQCLMLELFDALCGGARDMEGNPIGNSGQAVEQHVMRSLGYSRAEAVMLTKTALRYGSKIYEQDFDMNKVRELKALEIIADTAGAGDDVRAQLMARKQLQMVTGLTNREESDMMDAFRDQGIKALEDDDDEVIDV
jgi:hypothetical protein